MTSTSLMMCLKKLWWNWISWPPSLWSWCILELLTSKDISPHSIKHIINLHMANCFNRLDYSGGWIVVVLLMVLLRIENVSLFICLEDCLWDVGVPMWDEVSNLWNISIVPHFRVSRECAFYDETRPCWHNWNIKLCDQLEHVSLLSASLANDNKPGQPLVVSIWVTPSRTPLSSKKNEATHIGL